jgi:hypothetical protein
MGSYRAIPPEEVGQANFRLPDDAIDTQVDLYSP